MGTKHTARHTPGPWTASLVVGRYCAIELQPASNRARQRAIGNDRSGAGCKAELEANRALVEALPELLTALQALFDCDALCDGYRRDDNPEWDAAEVKLARAALAKAIR